MDFNKRKLIHVTSKFFSAAKAVKKLITIKNRKPEMYRLRRFRFQADVIIFLHSVNSYGANNKRE